MKTPFYLGIFTFCFSSVFCQVNNTSPWPSTGNVGIGTINPSDKLEIVSDQGVWGMPTGLTIKQLNPNPSNPWPFNMKGAAGVRLFNLTTQSSGNNGRNWGIYSLGVDDPAGVGNFAIYDITASNSCRFLITGSTGNVGIGTINPSARMHLLVKSVGDGLIVENDNYGESMIRLKTSNHNGKCWALASLSSNNQQGAGNFTIYDFSGFPNGGGDRFFINGSTGNVGIGTILPGVNRLNVDAASGHNGIRCNVNSDAERFFECFNKTDNIVTFQVWGNGNTVINSARVEVAGPDYERALTVVDAINSKTNFTVVRNGTVRAREIFVLASGINFPDYVFKAEYKLMPLTELDAFIKNNGHLPNVPKATEIEKEGIGLGDLTKIQMEKIEELTLYIIELQKQLDLQKKLIEALKPE